MKNFLFIVPLVALSLVSFGTCASDLDDLSLEELMDVKVNVATGNEQNLREAPGIISVITDKEIHSLGARNLKDILATVPGINFGHDVLGNISIIMRGVWAHEGRVLLLIDGLEMNERSYGTIFLSNHYPADHIKRIEIIRGPGSAIYGGFAELGVINITTKNGKDLNGGHVSSSYTRTSKEFGQSFTSFMLGQSTDDFDFSVKGSINKANFSDRSYTDENGVSASLGRGNSQSMTEYLNLRSKYKAIYINYIKDNYKTENIVLWGDLENTPGSGLLRKPVPKEYLTDVYQIGYQDDVSDQVNLHLYYQNKVQFPYLQPDTKNEVSLGNSWRRKVERKLYGAKSVIKLNKKSNLSIGSEVSEDISYSLNRLTYTGAPDVFGHNNSHKAQIQNLAVFGQYEQQTDLANFTAGVRYDKPSAFDSTVVPRLGVTKVVGKAHVKALFAKAFRSPTIENISLNKDIKPEITTTSEMEAGYQFNQNINWNLNLFSTQINDPIVYSYDSATVKENYTNYNYVKTIGLGTELHVKHDIHNLKLSYSTYKVDSLDAVPYKTGKDSSALIGSPRHKIFVRDTINVSEKIDVTPSFTYLSSTNSYEWDGSQFSEDRLDNQFMTNIFGNYKNFLVSGFDIGLGISNILNSNLFFAQPYVKQGDYRSGAYPAQSREFILKLAYTKEF